MRKVFIILSREYQAAVRSKAFIITLVMMPLLMFGSIGLQMLLADIDGKKTKKVVIIDRSPGAKLGAGLVSLFEVAAKELKNGPDAKLAKELTQYKFEVINASQESLDDLKKRRLDLSTKMDRDELAAVIEIGPKVMNTRSSSQTEAEISDDELVRLQAKSPTEFTLQVMTERYINTQIRIDRYQEKFPNAAVDITTALRLEQHVPIRFVGLTKLDKASGEINDGDKKQQIANLLIPGALAVLMFIVIMIGATPAMQGVVEEKSQRIAEVLLSSVSPFQLMCGKLAGLVGISLTMAIVYLAGGYVVARQFGVADLLTPKLLIVFFVFLIFALLVYGSLFIAVGAAANDIKDTQTLLMPVMLVATMPMLAFGLIIKEPNGIVSTICSLSPFSAPMVLTARQSIPPGPPLWEFIAGGISTILMTVACIWAAGRIFRVGILMQGQSPKLKELARWVIKGG